MAVDRKRVPPHLYERYGIKPQKTKTLIVISILLSAVIVGGFTVAGRNIINGGEITLITWKSSDTEVTIRWSVHRNDNKPVLCALRAQDSATFDIGYALVRVRDTAKTPQFTSTLAVNAPAYAVQTPVCIVFVESDPSRDAGLPMPRFAPGLLYPEQKDGLIAPSRGLPDWLN